MDTQELDCFFDQNFLAVVIVAAILVALYVVAPRVVTPAVRRVVQARHGGFEDSGVTAVELEKRARTIERLARTLIRALVVTTVSLIAVGILGLWGVLTGIGLVLAALTLAGQSIVLDYLMGMLIVIEGTCFEGDNISIGDPSWNVAGTVEAVGLRRTLIRGPDGTVHSISNADMRRVSNRTRVYAAVRSGCAASARRISTSS